MTGIAIDKGGVLNIHPSGNDTEPNHIPGLDDDMLSRISSILSLIYIPRDLHTQCINVFRLFLQRLIKSDSRQLSDRPRLETAVTACALIIARSHQLPISISDAAAWVSIDVGLLQTTYHQIATMLNDQISLPYCSPKIFIDRVLQAARCSGDADVVDVADRLLPICLEELVVLGRPSSSIAAAIVVVSYRAVYRKAMSPDQIARIECELNVMSIRSEIDLVLASLAGLASLLPFNAPFGPDSVDLYLPEIIYDLDQLLSIARLDANIPRAYGPFNCREINNRIDVAKAVIRVCRRLPAVVFTGELPVDIYSEELQLRLGAPKPHLDSVIEALIERSVSLVSILNGEYRLC